MDEELICDIIHPGSIWKRRSYIALSSSVVVDETIIFIVSCSGYTRFGKIRFMDAAGLMASLYIPYATFMHEFQHIAD